jgi:hypothetical protein
MLPTLPNGARPGRGTAMHWRDIHSDSPDRAWLGLEAIIEAGEARAVRPMLHMQAGRRRLMRLMAGAWPLLWARVEDDHHGYWYVRRELAERSPGLVVPPLTAVEARGCSESMGSEAWYRAWAKFFARKLEESAMSPLHAGRWWFAPAKAHLGPAGWRHISHRGPAIPPVCHLDGVAEQRAQDYAEWDFGDDLPPLAMRSMSSVEEDRVKAWRRGFRQGALPPALLMWISGLDRHVILDGHDRVLAALAEGATPPVLTVLRVQERQVDRDTGKARSIAEEVSAQLLAARDPDLRPRRPFTVEAANRLLIEGYDDRPHLSLVTRAWPLDGGARTWFAQVRQVLEDRGPSGEEAFQYMLAELDTPG